MAEFIKETTVVNASVKTESTTSQKMEYLIYFCLGTLEILLGFRLILKLMGASVSSGFVRLIYSLTGIFVMPFEGIFRKGFSQGLETTSVLEPATVVALIVYALLVWGMVKLLRVLSGKQPDA